MKNSLCHLFCTQNEKTLTFWVDLWSQKVTRLRNGRCQNIRKTSKKKVMKRRGWKRAVLRVRQNLSRRGPLRQLGLKKELSPIFLWQKEARDNSYISCKRAKCVCHFHWCKWNIMVSSTYLLAESDLMLKIWPRRRAYYSIGSRIWKREGRSQRSVFFARDANAAILSQPWKRSLSRGVDSTHFFSSKDIYIMG